MATTLSRRGFLKAGGGLVVAFTAPVYLDRRQVEAALPEAVEPGAPLIDQVDSWISIARDGAVTIFTGKVELGTGVETATRQIAADELDVALGRITVVQATTGRTPDQGYTAGSQSMKTQWSNGLRQAAATARQTLLELASRRLGLPASELTVEQGIVRSRSDPHKQVSYGELVGGRKLGTAISRTAPTKRPDQYRVIGTSVPRSDVPAKVTGAFTYVQDIRVPGMLHGRVVRPSRTSASSQAQAMAATAAGTLANGSLEQVDASSITGLPGEVKVVTRHDFVGVVAQREEQAIAAAQSLRVTWKDAATLPAMGDLYRAITSAPAGTTRVLADAGNVTGGLQGAARVFDAVYQHPYQMHASIGPSCAVADVRAGRATVWSGTQGVYPLRDAVAKLLDLQPDSVHVIYVEGSGCYGLNGADNAALDAALMSQAVGKPVRVQYMRHDEMAWENFGTPMVMHLRAGVDPGGTITSWDHEDWTANRGSRPGPPGNLPTGVLAGFPEPPPPPSPPPTPPLGDDSLNSMPSYKFANLRVRSYGVYQPWLFTGPLRSPSRLQNTFANESFMDEIASALQADPVAFRLRHATDPRLVAVIQKAAQSAGWQARPSPNPASSGGSNPATGRGMAAVHYEGNSSYLAMVVDVEIDQGSGQVRVPRVVVAHDCGVIINPDGLRLQIEGNVIHALSRALKEEVTFDRSGVTSVDWSSYPIMTFQELPSQLTIELINRPDQPALGAGEPTETLVAGALGNAIFDATGTRLRVLPFTPARVAGARRASP